MTDVKMKCAVRGMRLPGAMCGSVITGGEFCGSTQLCVHQVSPVTNGFDSGVDKSLADSIRSAEVVHEAYLLECFPVGTRVEAMIMYGQKVPTTGVVSGINATRHGGEVRILIDGSTARGSRRYRLVSARNVKVVEFAK